jgi:hypothetical protein
MFYVPRLTLAGAFVEATYVRAPDGAEARIKARELHEVTMDEVGPAQELAETYVTAMGITETLIKKSS